MGTACLPAFYPECPHADSVFSSYPSRGELQRPCWCECRANPFDDARTLVLPLPPWVPSPPFSRPGFSGNCPDCGEPDCAERIPEVSGFCRPLPMPAGPGHALRSCPGPRRMPSIVLYIGVNLRLMRFSVCRRRPSRQPVHVTAACRLSSPARSAFGSDRPLQPLGAG